MQDEPNVEDPKALFSKIGTYFRSLRDRVSSAYLADLVTFLITSLIRRLGRWPDRGEIVTETARLHAATQRFERAAHAAFNQAYAEARAPFLVAFWQERAARVPAELRARLEVVLALTPDGLLGEMKPFRFEMPDQRLCNALLMRDDEASKQLWREALIADQENFEPRKWPMYKQVLHRLLLETADLPAPVREEIEDGLAKSDHAPTVLSHATGQWMDACRNLVGAPEIGFGRSAYRLSPDDTSGSDRDRYDHLVKAFTQDPASALCLRTVMGEEVVRATANCAAWREGRPADGTLEAEGFRTLFLLRESGINSLRDAWDADEIIRLLDTLGVDLAAPAVRVVDRIGPLQGRPAYWYAYPAGEGMSLLVALHLRPWDPFFNAVFLVRGTVEEALSWLAEHYHARQWKQNRLELDDAPADVPRSVVAALQAEDAVASARERERQAKDFLATAP